MRTKKGTLRVFVLAFVLPAVGFALQGCADDLEYRRCFSWPREQGDNPSVCPSRDQALAIMTNEEPDIVSVESDGELDGNECCYDVVQSDGSRFDPFPF